MKDYTKIERIYEGHSSFPKEYLDMTIGDVLDTLESLDTAGDLEYEMLEGIFDTLKDHITGSYEQDDDLTPENSVEGSDDSVYDDGVGIDDESNDHLTFDSVVKQDGNAGDQQGIENFNF